MPQRFLGEMNKGARENVLERLVAFVPGQQLAELLEYLAANNCKRGAGLVRYYRLETTRVGVGNREFQRCLQSGDDTNIDMGWPRNLKGYECL